MNGQWKGHAQGDNNGRVILDLDNVDGRIQGQVVLWETEATLPGIVAEVTLTQDQNNITVTGRKVRPLDPDTGLVLDPTTFKDLYPDVALSSEIIVTASKDLENNFSGKYSTDTNLYGTVQLSPAAAVKSDTYSEEISWEGFKQLLWTNSDKRFLYRGQSDSQWPLRTTFHRSGRADLLRYFQEDLPRLYRHIHALTSLKFNLNDNQDIGALLYLAQHHGFPTPLLDWSFSPFVAAYFAFKDIQPSTSTHARIFVFDKDLWKKMTFQSEYYHTHGPTLTYNELLTSGNSRAMPQQAVTTFSNIDYIEETINIRKVQCLCAYDIPLSEAEQVLRDLRFMGITTGSLFPDLDGICQDLKEQHFT